jgi:hypothetical protein
VFNRHGWLERHSTKAIVEYYCHISDRTQFLRAIDCSGKLKNATFMFEVYKDAIDEVGPFNVVNVIIDATHVCRAAGLMVQS